MAMALSPIHFGLNLPSANWSKALILEIIACLIRDMFYLKSCSSIDIFANYLIKK